MGKKRLKDKMLLDEDTESKQGKYKRSQLPSVFTFVMRGVVLNLVFCPLFDQVAAIVAVKYFSLLLNFYKLSDLLSSPIFPLVFLLYQSMCLCI